MLKGRSLSFASALIAVALFGTFNVGGSAAVVAAQQPPGLQRVRVFVGFDRKPGAEEETIVRGAGGQIRHTYSLVPAIAATLPEGAINGLRNNPRVRYVEPDGDVTADDLATELNNSWGVKHIGSEAAWATSTGASVTVGGVTFPRVKVAVIDSGIDSAHPDLAANYDAADSWNFVAGNNNPFDDNGHGTHVSGTIGAVRDGLGVVGVAHGVTIMAVKVLNAQGSGAWSDVVAGVQWAVDHHAQVTNSSLGGSQDPGTTVAAAYAAAEAAGVVNIVSAGNSGTCAAKGNNVGYPGRYPSVLAVAATDASDKRPCFSSTGPAVGIAAPGVAVNSTVPQSVSATGYALFSGTSMASPHVAGVAALVIGTGLVTDISGTKGISDEVRNILRSTATDLGVAGVDQLYGAGLVNAAAAVAAASGGGPPPPPPTLTMFVQSVTYSTSGGGKNGDRNLRIEVLVLDSASAPVANATVSVAISRNGTLVGTGTAATTATGVAAFSVSNAASGTYSTQVTGLQATGYTWNPSTTPVNSYIK